jgi:hypothetical protein
MKAAPSLCFCIPDVLAHRKYRTKCPTPPLLTPLIQMIYFLRKLQNIVTLLTTYCAILNVAHEPLFDQTNFRSIWLPNMCDVFPFSKCKTSLTNINSKCQDFRLKNRSATQANYRKCLREAMTVPRMEQRSVNRFTHTVIKRCIALLTPVSKNTLYVYLLKLQIEVLIASFCELHFRLKARVDPKKNYRRIQ